MRTFYRLAYAVGFRPWDSDRPPPGLVQLVEEDGGLPAGRALDLGCGTGAAAVYLARRGWRVTAVDALDRPLAEARRRAEAAGVEVDLRRGDVTRLERLGLAGGVELFLDVGCLHGLGDAERAAYARGVEALAAPDARLLLFGLHPHRRPWLPRGVDRAGLEQALGGGWTVEAVEEGDGLRAVGAAWYRLRRRPPPPARAAGTPARPGGVEGTRRPEGRFLRVTTHRRDGTPVSTPVLFTAGGDRVWIWTRADSLKVRRLRADPRVVVAASDSKGRPRGPSWSGIARVVGPVCAPAERLFGRKYGPVLRAWQAGHALARRLGRGRDWVYVEITLGGDAGEVG